MADEYGLGRRWELDLRDLNYRLSAVLPEQAQSTSRYWIAPSPTDQGRTSHCVGHAHFHHLLAAPTVHWRESMRLRLPSPDHIYAEAQKVDEWPGEEPVYEGTSVRAGAKVLQAMGRVREYRWALTVDEVRMNLLERGTIVFGTKWYGEMFTPDSNGFVRARGSQAGGHAYLGVGWSHSRRAARCLNSWGPGWGQRGRFWIGEDDLAVLLADWGEACSLIEKMPDQP